MLYRIILSTKAAKFLNILDKKRRLNVIKTLEDLADYPFALRRHDVKKIEGRKCTFRVRTGDIRTVFYIDEANENIVVLKIGHRESIYE